VAYETEEFLHGIVGMEHRHARITNGAIGRHFYRGLISNGNRLEFLISGLTREGKGTSCAGTLSCKRNLINDEKNADRKSSCHVR